MKIFLFTVFSVITFVSTLNYGQNVDFGQNVQLLGSLNPQPNLDYSDIWGYVRQWS